MTRTLVGTPDEGGSPRARIAAAIIVGLGTYYVAKNVRGPVKAVAIAAAPAAVGAVAVWLTSYGL